ncbi:SMI1-KNR4 cell-wall [Flexibacter flexilis DSM 6793]|uniref:SMI1-KNR4 cell-wall n=2 Tax=Flexibacter flexilis TaxID=998 RepID=A0A1I1DCD7_9BACT|nr:SMI1-KNR4 cell-wall [Flexibacter flexilis DSM 6793]
MSLQGDPLSVNDIEKAEEQLGRQIPDEYKAFLLQFNGGHPEPCNFVRPMHDTAIDSVSLFYGLFLKYSYNLIGIYNEYAMRMPTEFLPIASVGGCQICICTDGENIGKLYFWDSDEENPDEEQPCYDNIYLLSDSFTAFINSLS